MSGTLYGIGVGPGDPELVTRKAWRLIGSLPVIVFPASRPGRSLARSIVAEAIAPTSEAIEVVIPIRRQSVSVEESYDRGAEIVARRLEDGKDVGVLCLGDPLFYGSFIYFRERLAGRFACKVVPGVTALTGGAAISGRALAAGDDVVTVIPATLPAEEIEGLLEKSDVAVVMKLGRHLPKVREVVERMGRAGHALYVENVSLPGEIVVPLAEAPGTDAPYFSMLLITRGRSW